MNRGILLAIAGVFGSAAVQAHVSQSQGMAHAFEHFWLVLLLAPLWLLARPAAKYLSSHRKR
jgi:hypothetical protein